MEDENKMRRRLKIDRNLNERIKSLAKEKKVTTDVYIEDAIQFFIDYEQENIQSDNIYTKRINELTKQIELIRHENASLNQAMMSRLDTILEYQNPTNYL